MAECHKDLGRFIVEFFGGQRVIAEFGIGLASAVLIDAFVIRTVLVPAIEPTIVSVQIRMFSEYHFYLGGFYL